MAVADVTTWNLLNQWPIVMAESGWHFNQISGSGSFAPLSHDCDQVYIDEERRQIADAIVAAVETAAGYLHYYPRPTYLTERIYFEAGFPYWNQSLELPYGYLQAFGSRAVTLIDDAVAIAYSDADGDGVNDTATITVTTSITDTSEIRIFFQVADGAPAAADERWEIEPTTVTVSGGTATIVAKKWLFAHPETVWAVPYDGPSYEQKHSGNTGTAGDFVTHVDVYRVYTTSANALTLNYGPECPCDSFAYDTYDGTGLIVNARDGLFRVRAGVDSCAGYWPVSMDVKYLAGVPLKNNMMDRELQTMLIRLANCKMPQQLQNFCGRPLTMWQFDTMYPPPNFINGRMENPIGMKMGEIMAWEIIQRRAIGQGGKVA